MPFDPALPGNHDDIEAPTLRAQFNGLYELIQAGSPGLTGFVLDGVTTLGPDEPATATLTFEASIAHLTLGLPQGQPGTPGEPGSEGGPGPVGPPLAGILIDAVNALPWGDAPTVDAFFDGTDVHLTFGLPAGPAGEVSATQLNDAIATTAQNPATFPAYTGTFSDPVTQAEMQDYAAYVESMRQWMSR